MSPAKFIKPREKHIYRIFGTGDETYAQRTKIRFYSIHFNSTCINEYLVCGSAMLGAVMI